MEPSDLKGVTSAVAHPRNQSVCSVIAISSAKRSLVFGLRSSVFGFLCFPVFNCKDLRPKAKDPHHSSLITHHSSLSLQSLPQTQKLLFVQLSNVQPAKLRSRSPVETEPCASTRSDRLQSRIRLGVYRGYIRREWMKPVLLAQVYLP